MDKQQEAHAHPPTYNEAMLDPADPNKPAVPGYPAPGYLPQGQPVQGYPPPGQPFPGQLAPGYTPYPVYQQGYPIVQYGQNVQVIQSQPMLGTQPSTPPPDHMHAAVFVTLCCFWPTGIIAIMKANDAKCALARGDMMSAHLAAKSSKQMINISIVVGIITLIIAGVFIGLYFGLVLSHLNY